MPVYGAIFSILGVAGEGGIVASLLGVLVVSSVIIALLLLVWEGSPQLVGAVKNMRFRRPAASGAGPTTNPDLKVEEESDKPAPNNRAPADPLSLADPARSSARQQRINQLQSDLARAREEHDEKTGNKT
ncbi:MAG: hypothetical protein R3360_05130 [Alphaproteobacteria bacterium]|nr:hypothetical protein [Alphaproteobacteria bacterium]